MAQETWRTKIKREKKMEKKGVAKEITDNNFPNFVEETHNQIQVTQNPPNKIDLHRYTARGSAIKI